MGTASLIASLIPVVTQFGPGLVKQATDLIQGNPQKPGETDDDYIARINTEITAVLNDAAAKDAQVENS
jgi:hypothetical protein